jgi:ABC transport system ATP-binding/permease protein
MASGIELAHVRGLRLTMGESALFDDAGFVLHKGERAAFVGANGAGKSTLMRMLAAAAEPDAGEIAFASGVTVAWAEQDSDLSGFATLRDYACAPTTPRAPASTPAHAADAALLSFGHDPERAPTGLSGGEARRAALARAFAVAPDLLLLDEPTNHLDIAAIEALEERLQQFRGACLVISHDRRFLERVSTTTLWLHQRRLLKLDRGFVAYDDWAESVELEETRTLARLETHLRAEEHWLQRGVTARRSRNEGRRRRLEAMRAERRERKLATTRQAAISADKGGESARLVIDARGVSKGYGDTSLISNLSLRIRRGDRVGVVGPNGAGKTTLLEVLLGKRAPDQGVVRIGENLRVAYVDQARAELNPQDTVWSALTPQGGDQVMVRGQPRHVAAYARDFLFGPTQLRQPVASLSGGERNRLALALALAQPANLLVLDEPTNDLDMDTLDALEETLAGYDGTVLLVSHDRAFLDGVATQIIGPIGAGRWAEAPGGWSDFEREYGGFRQRSAAPIAKSNARPAPRERKAPNKLSYKDERRAAEIEDRVLDLQREINDLEQALAAADAFTRDPNAYAAAAKRLQQARAELDAVETEWISIELQRDQLAKGD